jgi:hypothetical protein
MFWMIAHDAGGAEMVSSWALHQKEPFKLIAEGPAVAIFGRKFPNQPIFGRMELASAQEVDFFLLGTGWASDLERLGIKVAKDVGIRSIAFLEHWCNYLERFTTPDGVIQLPDEIWTGDEYALKLAEDIFSQFPVSLKQVPNHYLQDMVTAVQDIAKLEKFRGGSLDSAVNILYLCEAISEHHPNTDTEPFEFRAISKFFDWYGAKKITGLFGSGPIQIRFRLHPAEPRNKYDGYLEKFEGVDLTLSKNPSLSVDLAWADHVVGMTSMALVVALSCGKKTYSCIPGDKPSFELPHDGIIKI